MDDKRDVGQYLAACFVATLRRTRTRIIASLILIAAAFPACIAEGGRDATLRTHASVWRTPVLSSPERAVWAVAVLLLVGALAVVWLSSIRLRASVRDVAVGRGREYEARLETRYQRLFQSNLASVLTFTPDGQILDCNSAFAHLLGFRSTAEAMLRNLHQLAKEGELACFVSSIRHSGSTAYSELRLLAADRREVIALASGVWEHGPVPVIHANLIDVTAQREFERQLVHAKDAAETANRLKSQFLANMSHEIRTPLNGVLGMVSLALSDELPPESRQYLELAQQSANHLLSLINDLLDFSKAEAGKLTLEQAPFATRDLFRKALRTLALRAQEKGLELLCDVDYELPDELIGDPHRLLQILLNLLGNAVKFTNSGEVELKAAGIRTGDRFELTVSVRDTGIGISNEAQSRIFAPFTQADGSTTRKYGGTGLGLSICRHLVTLMGGHITLTSEPGRGSTFSFTCALGIPSDAKPRNMKIPELAGRTAIVALTNTRSSTIVAEALRKWGIACFEESDIRTAVARIASTRNKLSHDPFLIYDLRECPSGAGPAVAGCTVIPVGDYSTLGAKLPGPAPILKPIDLDELRERMVSAVSPAQPAAVNSRPEHSKSEDPSQRLSILLAEDNPVNQKVACAILGRLGHRVDVVGTGSAAVQAAQTGAYDVVLMDIQMPEMDGFEATARIRSLPDQRTANLPIIALTAHTMEGYRDRCLQAGMDDYLTKPLSAELLSQVLNAVAPPEKKLTHAL